MSKLNLFQVLAHQAVARQNCVQINKPDWFVRHRENANKLVKEHLLFSRVDFDIDESGDSRLVFSIDYSYIDGGKTTHQVIVTPSLCDMFSIRVTGSNRHDSKSNITAAFTDALMKEAFL